MVWKVTNKKKKKNPLLITPFIFNFPRSFLQFSFFSSPFPPFLFLLASFLVVGQQKYFLARSLWGALCSPPPTSDHCMLSFGLRCSFPLTNHLLCGISKLYKHFSDKQCKPHPKSNSPRNLLQWLSGSWVLNQNSQIMFWSITRSRTAWSTKF